MKISIKTKLTTYFSSIWLYASLLPLLFTYMTFAYNLQYRLDWGELMHMNKQNIEHTTGIVESSLFNNEKSIYKTTFSFLDTKNVRHENYTEIDKPLNEKSNIEIEYAKDHPETSRIKGYKNTNFDSQVFYLFLFFVQFLGLFIYSFLGSRKKIRTFKNSYFTLAQAIDKKPWHKKGEPHGTFKINYTYLDENNQEQTTSIVSNNQELKKSREPQLIFIHKEKTTAVIELSKGIKTSLMNDFTQKYTPNKSIIAE